MTETITNEDLVRFIFDETDDQEKELIKNAIQQSVRLKEEFEMLFEAKRSLDNANAKPSDSVVENILEYSKNKNMQKC